jgi:hypothetical protein
MTTIFGVKASDVEQAYLWVEAATSLTAEARESSDWGGNYYLFTGQDGERVKLLSNRDIYDDEPVVDGCDGWKIVLLLESVPESSSILQGLERDRLHFQKLIV